MNYKILITGAGGYIGSVAAYLLLQKGYEVVALDNFSTGFHGPLDLMKEKFGERIRYYEVNLLENLSPIFDKEKNIAAVLHYAANCSVNESMENPVKYFSNNACATQNFLTYVLKNGIKNIVFSSTCAVYGEAKSVPIDEKHPTNPTNPYGASKRMIEQILEWYSRLKDLKYVALRYFNVCGATDDSEIGDSKKPSVHLMQNAVRGALGIEPFQLTCGKFDTPDGTPIRDYVNVVDLNEAHILALNYLLNGGKSEVINLGTGDGNSVMEIIKKVEEATGKKIEVKQGEARKGEYAKMIASTEKAKSILKWSPHHSLQESVKTLVAWYTKHPHGWEK
ncbi:UDP-glucose 4-epimerase GalE [Candidatus Roizmanbacteria bacterium RIFCSPLOWO2_01_FULL_38_12]|uniref:UDP-glucose 4-epimerase n=1 Tax=Candidatus Roizmanbacteria bacterium RIFCSPLOWO2_01_FULL_38_12 TaxID=1802061 RepID=A0A1F7IQX9_9BACT|nr:MAG: UDP-glucose 4-epimerase GalE [Candidatus Roizmanbacteria bacterium RIFCSPLOWO2_01_FULL_38_12]